MKTSVTFQLFKRLGEFNFLVNSLFDQLNETFRLLVVLVVFGSTVVFANIYWSLFVFGVTCWSRLAYLRTGPDR